MNERNLKPTEIYDNIWLDLNNAVNDRSHDYRHAFFSSIESKDTPNSRTVILREVSKNSNFLIFHTDYRSNKIREIKKNKKNLLLFYSIALKQQLRIKVESVIEYNNQVSKNAWDNTTLMSRKCYLTKYEPGFIINKPTDGISENLKGKEPSLNESLEGYKNFAVVKNYIKCIDWLFLSSNGHIRLEFIKTNEKLGSKWLIP